MESSSQFEFVVRPSLALVVFRLVPPVGGNNSLVPSATDAKSLNSLNRIFHRRISASGLFLTQTEVNGVFCIRLAVGAVRTQEKHIDMAWQMICAEVEPAMGEWTERLAM